jgi:hypothetical protein
VQVSRLDKTPIHTIIKAGTQCLLLLDELPNETSVAQQRRTQQIDKAQTKAEAFLQSMVDVFEVGSIEYVHW